MARSFNLKIGCSSSLKAYQTSVMSAEISVVLQNLGNLPSPCPQLVINTVNVSPLTHRSAGACESVWLNFVGSGIWTLCLSQCHSWNHGFSSKSFASFALFERKLKVMVMLETFSALKNLPELMQALVGHQVDYRCLKQNYTIRIVAGLNLSVRLSFFHPSIY